MRVSLALLLALFAMAHCAPAPGGGLGHGGVVQGDNAQNAYDKHYGSGFLEELGEKLSDIRGKVDVLLNSSQILLTRVK